MIAKVARGLVSYTGRMPVMVEGIEYLTAEEAATALGVKRETLYAYASRGRLRSYRRGTGRARLYRADEIRALTQIRADRPPDYLVDASTWMDGHS
jgi:excisionase family DNA binding protein